MINCTYASNSKLTTPKQRDRISTKKPRLVDLKIQISPIPSLYANKQQETLSAKVKGEKKIAQVGIQKDYAIKMRNIL